MGGLGEEQSRERATPAHCSQDSGRPQGASPGLSFLSMKLETQKPQSFRDYCKLTQGWGL